MIPVHYQIYITTSQSLNIRCQPLILASQRKLNQMSNLMVELTNKHITEEC